MPSSWSENARAPERKRSSAVASGFKWGFGFAVAHRVVDVLLGPRVVKHKTVESSPRAPAAEPAGAKGSIGEACDGQSKALLACLDGNVSDISKCQSYLDMLKRCRTDAKSTSSA